VDGNLLHLSVYLLFILSFLSLTFSPICLVYFIIFLYPASSLAGRAPSCGGVARYKGFAMQWRVINRKHSRRMTVRCPPYADISDKGKMYKGCKPEGFAPAARGFSVCHNDAGFMNNDKCAIGVDTGVGGR
jgi:hypothetical protein